MADFHQAVAGLCSVCKSAIRPNDAYQWREVTGWQQFAQDGTPKSVVSVKGTGRFICNPCKIESTGWQGAMFDDET